MEYRYKKEDYNTFNSKDDSKLMSLFEQTVERVAKSKQQRKTEEVLKSKIHPYVHAEVIIWRSDTQDAENIAIDLEIDVFKICQAVGRRGVGIPELRR